MGSSVCGELDCLTVCVHVPLAPAAAIEDDMRVTVR